VKIDASFWQPNITEEVQKVKIDREPIFLSIESFNTQG